MSSKMYSSEHMMKVGPRAKCDQVVYEAIAKAAEIIVRGRCECPTGNGTNNSNNGGAGGGVGNSGGNGTSSSSGGGGSISRFHLEVEEVPMVRNILQMWRKCLHVPLRLDVYYEYCTDPTDPTKAEQTTRKELLERWCIDYLPDDHHSSMMNTSSASSSSSSSHMSTNTNTSSSGRTNSHNHPYHSPQQQQQQYNPQQQQQQQPRFHYHPQQYQQQTQNDEIIAQLRQVVKRVVILLRVLHSQTRLMPAYRLHHELMEDLKGHIHSTNFNVNHRPIGSGPGLGGGYYNHATTSNNHHTPSSAGYGHGYGHGQQIPSDPNAANNRARNLVGGRINYSFYVSDSVSSVGSGGGGGDSISNASDSTAATLFSSSTNSPFARHDLSPIPTPFGLLRFAVLYDDSLDVERVLTDRARRIINLGLGQGQGQHHQQQQQHQNLHQQYAKGNFTRSIPIKTGSAHSVGYNNDHISQRYAAANMERPKSAEPRRQEFRERLGSDPGRGFAQNKEKRVMSGLSLALMNDEESKTPPADNTTTGSGTPTLGGIGIDSATPPSPLLRPAISIDSANSSSLKQRLALHHPPPSYSDQGSVGQAQAPLHGTGMNATSSRGNSPSPMPMSLAHTPPQPMFIGSFPRSLGTAGMVRPGTPKDPPFRNPTSLQQPSISTTTNVNELSSVMMPTSIGNNSGANASSTSATISNNVNVGASPVMQAMQANSTLLPPLNSQDALCSNPFKSSIAQSMIATGVGIGGNNTLNKDSPALGSVNASAFSSLVLGKGSAVYGPGDEGFPLALPLASESSSLMPGGRFGSSDYLGRSGNNVFSNHAANNREEDADDMPFVVELESNENELSNISTPKLSRQNSAIDMSTTSSGTMSSQVVSSLAHRCSTAGRLKLFSDNEVQGGGGGSILAEKSGIVEELTNQLADFRSFGESITSSGLVPGGK